MALEIGLAAYCLGGLLALLLVLATGRARHAFTNIGAVLRPLVMRLRGIPLVSEPMPLPSVGGMPYALAVSFGALAVLWLRHH
jgi:prepilin peptidase CpaA